MYNGVFNNVRTIGVFSELGRATCLCEASLLSHFFALIFGELAR